MSAPSGGSVAENAALTRFATYTHALVTIGTLGTPAGSYVYYVSSGPAANSSGAALTDRATVNAQTAAQVVQVAGLAAGTTYYLFLRALNTSTGVYTLLSSATGPAVTTAASAGGYPATAGGVAALALGTVSGNAAQLSLQLDLDTAAPVAPAYFLSVCATNSAGGAMTNAAVLVATRSPQSVTATRLVPAATQYLFLRSLGAATQAYTVLSTGYAVTTPAAVAASGATLAVTASAAGAVTVSVDPGVLPTDSTYALYISSSSTASAAAAMTDVKLLTSTAPQTGLVVNLPQGAALFLWLRARSLVTGAYTVLTGSGVAAQAGTQAALLTSLAFETGFTAQVNTAGASVSTTGTPALDATEVLSPAYSKSYSIQTSSSYVTLGGLTASAPWTYEFWLKATNATATTPTRRAVTRHNVSFDRGVQIFNSTTETRLHFDGNNGSSAGFQCPGLAHTAWHHYAFVNSGADFSAYQDGVLVVTAAASTLTMGTTIDIAIGHTGLTGGAAGVMLGNMSDFVYTQAVKYTAPFVPAQRTLLSIVPGEVQHATALAAATGSISATAVSGGTGPYSAVWTNSGTGSTAITAQDLAAKSSLAPGLYRVVVSDSIGLKGAVSYDVGSPLSLYANTTGLAPTTYSDGSIGSATVVGGLTSIPLVYYFKTYTGRLLRTNTGLSGLPVGPYAVEALSGSFAVRSVVTISKTGAPPAVLQVRSTLQDTLVLSTDGALADAAWVNPTSTLGGAPVYGAGPLSGTRALVFSGTPSNKYLELPYYDALNFKFLTGGSAWSFGGWVNATTAANHMTFSNLTPTPVFNGIEVFMQPNSGLARGGVYVNNANPVSYDVAVPGLSIWTHLWYVFDPLAQSTTVYVNGNPTQTGGQGTAGVNAAYSQMVSWRVGGSRGAVNQSLVGSMFDVRFYVGFKSVTEVHAHPRFTPGTVTPVGVRGDLTGVIGATALAFAVEPVTVTWSSNNGVALTGLGYKGGLKAGTYTLTASDATNSTVKLVYALTEPMAIVPGVVTPARYTGLALGAIAATTVLGGTGTFPSVVWTTLTVGATAISSTTLGALTGLLAGSYKVTVTDDSGNSASYTYVVGEPAVTLRALVPALLPEPAATYASAANSYYGNAVAVDGVWSIVGMPYNNAAFFYEYVNNLWVQRSAILDLNTFGTFAVAISGAYAVSCGSNRVFSFQRSGSTWSLKHQLGVTANNVAIDATTLTAVTGFTVYTLDATGLLTLQQTLTGTDTVAADNFGRGLQSAAVAGNTVAIGSPLWDQKTPTAVTDCGAVYVFTRSGSTWTQSALLTQDVPTASSGFGQAVALNTAGTRLVVGAPYWGRTTPTALSQNGAVYVFDLINGSWTQRARLQALDASSGDHLGESVSLSGTSVLAGAKDWDSKGSAPISNVGAAYQFTEFESLYWVQTARYESAEAGSANQNFGNGVAIQGSRILVGAPNAYKEPLAGPGGSLTPTNLAALQAYGGVKYAGMWSIATTGLTKGQTGTYPTVTVPALNYTQSFTIEAFVYVTSNLAGAIFHVSKNKVLNTDNLLLRGTGALYAAGGTANSTPITTTAGIALNAYKHVAITYDATAGKLYCAVNGAVTSGTPTQLPLSLPTGQPINIFWQNDSAADNYVVGYFDCLRVSQAALYTATTYTVPTAAEAGAWVAGGSTLYVNQGGEGYYRYTGVTCALVAPLIIVFGTIVPATASTTGSIGATTVYNGVSPYSYSWSTSSARATAITATTAQAMAGLAAGLYVLTVTDSIGTVGSASAVVEGPLVITTATVGPETRTSSEGSIVLTPSGGLSVYSYVWTKAGTAGTFATTKDLLGIGVGTYSVTVSSGTAYSATLTIVLDISRVISFLTTPYSVKVTFSAIPGALAYRVEYQASSPNSVTQVYATNTARTVFVIPGLTPQSTYAVRVYSMASLNGAQTLVYSEQLVLPAAPAAGSVAGYSRAALVGADGTVDTASVVVSAGLSKETVLNSILSSGDLVSTVPRTNIGVAGGGLSVVTSFVKLTETSTVTLQKKVYIPFAPSTPGQQIIYLKLRSGATEAVLYNPSVETVTIRGVDYGVGSSLQLDGQVLNVFGA